MLPYNTDLKPIVLPEYGRNIQQMIEYCISIQDKGERTICANAIAELIAKLFPELVGANKSYQKIWDQMNVISKFKLDIDFPYPVISEASLHPKPNIIPYSNASMRYRHYGKNIERMIKRVAEMEEGNEKELLISMIAHHMKKLQLLHNKEGVEDGKILRDLRDYSDGQINLDPEKYLLHEYQEAKVNQEKNKTKKKKKK